MNRIAAVLAQAIEALEGGVLLVVTGAGISQASGIPTFRGAEPGAIWKTNDVDLATFGYFKKDPVGQWSWYLQRFESVRHARPNDAHQALVRLDHWLTARNGHFRLVTQNIDTLHEQAGARDLIKIHGTSDRVRCSRPGCPKGSPRGSIGISEVDFSSFEIAPDRAHLPRCPDCGALIRAHVLFFDEFYLEHVDYKFSEAETLAQEAHMILFIGTSFSVGITDLYLRAGRQRGLPMFSIDPAAQTTQLPGLRTLAAPAEELLPMVNSLLS